MALLFTLNACFPTLLGKDSGETSALGTESIPTFTAMADLPSASTAIGEKAIITIDGVDILIVSDGTEWQPAVPSSVARLTPETPELDFDPIEAGDSTTLELEWDNNGGLQARDVSVSYSGTGEFLIGETTCSGNLGTGSSCVTEVTFTPTTQATQSGTLTLTFNNGLRSQTVSVTIAGTGVAPGSVQQPSALVISGGPTFDFGTISVGQTNTTTFTVINAGPGTATGITESVTAALGSPFSFLSGTYPGSSGTCGGSLAAYTSCTLRVAFTPTTSGASSDTLTLSYLSNGTPSTATLNLTGTSYTAPQVSAGTYHACARISTGAVKCWGQNTSGELGVGDTTNRLVPTQVLGIDGSEPSKSAVKVVAGTTNTCVLLANKTVKCWGTDWYGVLGTGGSQCFSSCAVGSNHTPGSIVVGLSGTTPATSVLDLAVAQFSACVIVETGAVKCWGQNTSGQNGVGTIGQYSGTSSPVNVTGLDGSTSASKAVRILGSGTVGNGHGTFCALMENGDLKCWGRNFDNQFALPADTNDKPTPVTVPGVSNPIDVAVGGGHICVIKTDRRVYCAGYGYDGGLGNGTNISPYRITDFSTPMLNVNGTTPGQIEQDPGQIAQELLVGGTREYPVTCVRFDDDKVKCTGQNGGGNWPDDWGRGTYSLFDYREAPGTLASHAISDVAALGTGGNGSIFCVIKSNETVRCASQFYNYGQLGNGSTTGPGPFISVAPSI
jgi:hypothetical protein